MSNSNSVDFINQAYNECLDSNYFMVFNILVSNDRIHKHDSEFRLLVLHRLSTILIKNNKHEEVIIILNKCLEINVNDSCAIVNLIIVNIILCNFEIAQDYLTKYKELVGINIDTCDFISEVENIIKNKNTNTLYEDLCYL